MSDLPGPVPNIAGPSNTELNIFVVTPGEFARQSQPPSRRKSQPRLQRSQRQLGLQSRSQQGIESQDDAKGKERLIRVAKRIFVAKASSMGYFFVYKRNEDEDEQQEFNILVRESLNQAVLETGGANSIFSFKGQF